MKNVACSRLGTMLYLEIQKGKEAMKILGFQKDIRGTAECMRILEMDNKVCAQLTQNYTYFSDIWFSRLKTAEEAMTVGVYYCAPVKTSHNFHFLVILEKFMSNFPVG